MATASLIIDIVIALVCVIIIIKNAARGFIKSFKDGEKTTDGLATFSETNAQLTYILLLFSAVSFVTDYRNL